jgi:phosphopantothenoylcysteine decarboxylase/phosphopantothenate--cysteine ligase
MLVLPISIAKSIESNSFCCFDYYTTFDGNYNLYTGNYLGYNKKKLFGGKLMLKGKTVLLGVTGGIAAYKAAALASALVKQHAAVEVIMTKNATEFIAPLTFEQLTGRKCLTDTFDRNFIHQVEHISLAERTDLVIIAPATANVCAKLAHGLADDMLTTTVLACRCPKLIAPAMNTNMFENPVTQDNLEILRKYGWDVIEPASGRLACGAVGKGKLPEPEELLQYVLKYLAMPHDLEGRKILVTAGPTQESLDPVRYLTNHSTGKMGYAIAKMAMLRGADVTLVTGPTSIAPPPFVNVVHITSAADMFEAVTARAVENDMIIKSAAVADYTPADYADNKLKKKDGDMSIPLKRTQDILSWLGEHRQEGQIICGFSMETENMLENSRVKLAKKNVDMICANNLKQSGAGFGVDTNVITLITRDIIQELPLLTKEQAANTILDQLMKM